MPKAGVKLGLEVMSVFEKITSIAFDPQPEPPGQSVTEMFNIIDLLKVIAAPAEAVPTVY